MADKIGLFLDSNVVLSGLLSSKGSPRILLDLLSLNLPLLHGMIGQYNLDEIERNLRRRFPALLSVYQEYLPKLFLEVIEVPSYKEIEGFLDRMSPKDAPVLASALAGKADYLVTGNKKDFPKGVAKPIAVLSPSEVLRMIAQFVQGVNS